MEALTMKFTLKVDGYSLIEMLFMLFIVGVLCSTVALSFKEFIFRQLPKPC
jgi:Tfp pilus assembly protein PilE